VPQYSEREGKQLQDKQEGVKRADATKEELKERAAGRLWAIRGCCVTKKSGVTRGPLTREPAGKCGGTKAQKEWLHRHEKASKRTVEKRGDLVMPVQSVERTRKAAAVQETRVEGLRMAWKDETTHTRCESKPRTSL